MVKVRQSHPRTYLLKHHAMKIYGEEEALDGGVLYNP
jgi:hypothetical protein